ncbi:MAG: DUF2807 domain-containing protein [Sphingobacteriales bacterium]|nr:MAG: DUF2807 domain-containing protein [Sphingobacteriales bacterium]
MRPGFHIKRNTRVAGHFITVLLLTLSAAILLCSCGRKIISGQGDIVTEQRTATSFTEVNISAPVKTIITVSPSSPASIQLKGYKNLLDNIRTDIKDGRLSISVKDAVIINTDEDIIAEITCGDIAKLSAKGSSDVQVGGVIRNKQFETKLSGAGDVLIDNLLTGRFICNISGAGRLDVKSGAVTKADLKVSGAGSIKAFGLFCTDANANVSGAGLIELRATQKLNAKITGAGDIAYKGAPAVTSSVSGAGTISNAN